MGTRRLALAIGATVLIATAIWQVRLIGDVRVDDAYIAFSFSRNVATGAGPVFSAGSRVEGYSNFLWMMLLAGPMALLPAADPFTVARVMAAPFLGLLFGAMYSLGRLRAGPTGAVLGTLLLASHSDFFAAGLSGLETTPFVALVTVGFALYLHGRTGNARARAWAMPCLATAALMRIDGFLVLGYVAAWELATAVAERRLAARDQLRFAGPAVAVFLGWFAWRWHYYGYPLPSPAYAKNLISTALPGQGSSYLQLELGSLGTIALLPVAAFAFLRRRREAAFLALFPLLHLFYVSRIGGDWMPYARFVLPAIPPLVALFVLGASELLHFAGRLALLPVVGPDPESVPPKPIGRIARALAALVVAVGALQTVRAAHRFTTDDAYEQYKIALSRDQTRHVRELIQAAQLLDRALPSGARLVTDYAGVFGYFSHAFVIDMWGLCTVEIAREGDTLGVQPLYGKTCPKCYPALHPEFFHVGAPLIRSPNAFRSRAEVVNAVWQTGRIGEFLNFRQDFVVGRVVQDQRAIFFLERRRAGAAYGRRQLPDRVVVDYPFGA